MSEAVWTKEVGQNPQEVLSLHHFLPSHYHFRHHLQLLLHLHTGVQGKKCSCHSVSVSVDVNANDRNKAFQSCSLCGEESANSNFYVFVFVCIFCGCIFDFVFVSFLWWETWESCLLCGEESFSHILLWNKFAIHGFSCLRPHQSTHVICYCNILETSFKTLFNFIISFISTYTRWWLFFHFTFTSPLNV